MGLMFPIYFISLVLSAGMTLLSVYQIIELSDLDCEYSNPRRCCTNLNRLVLPELLCVALVVILHTVTLNWLPVATTLPVLAWLYYMYHCSASVFNPTSICDQRVLNRHVRESLFRIVFYILHFLGFMYMAIFTLITV